VRNLSDQTIVGQAVPSVSPTVAARHFRKLDCFCFTQQTLAPGESREMALTFIIDGDIGDEISELTLAYAFFLAPKDPAPALNSAHASAPHAGHYYVPQPSLYPFFLSGACSCWPWASSCR
jgi:cytochrome c oxidase assembly protein subunit 11